MHNENVNKLKVFYEQKNIFTNNKYAYVYSP